MKLALLILLLFSPIAVAAQSMRIDSMHVDEARDQLLIYGDFGSEHGEVIVDSVSMEIVRWMPNWIRCKIPRSGKGSCGPVIVRNGIMVADSSLLTHVTAKIRAYSSSNASSTSSHYFGECISEWHLNFRFDRICKFIQSLTSSPFSASFWYELQSIDRFSNTRTNGRASGNASKTISSDTGKTLLTSSIVRVSDTEFVIQFEEDSWMNYVWSWSSNRYDYNMPWSGEEKSGGYSGQIEGLTMRSCKLTISDDSLLLLSNVEGKAEFDIYFGYEAPFTPGKWTLVSSSIEYFPTKALGPLKVVSRRITETSLFPNPTSGIINFDNANGNSILRATIFDYLGREVMVVEARDLQNGNCDTSVLPNGSYVLLFEDDSSQYAQKFIKW